MATYSVICYPKIADYAGGLIANKATYSVICYPKIALIYIIAI